MERPGDPRDQCFLQPCPGPYWAGSAKHSYHVPSFQSSGHFGMVQIVINQPSNLPGGRLHQGQWGKEEAWLTVAVFFYHQPFILTMFPRFRCCRYASAGL